MKKRLLTFFSLAIYLSSFAQTLPLKQDVFAKMKLVNDYWISTNTSPGNNQWARAVYFAGNLDFYKYYPKDSKDFVEMYHQLLGKKLFMVTLDHRFRIKSL